MGALIIGTILILSSMCFVIYRNSYIKCKRKLYGLSEDSPEYDKLYSKCQRNICYRDDDIVLLFSIVAFIIGVAFLIGSYATQISLNNTLRKLELQRNYIETYTPKTESEIIGIVNSKIEINSELFELQSKTDLSKFMQYMDWSKLDKTEPIK